MKILQIVGRKNAGKTGLIVRLIPALRARGLRVGTVKHSCHDHELDDPSRDSGRHRAAGADATLVVAGSSGALHFTVPSSEPEALIARYLGGLDLVLVEGWRSLSAAKIEVLPVDADGLVSPPRITAADGLVAVVLGPGVTGDAAAFGVPGFEWDELEGIVGFLGEWSGG